MQEGDGGNDWALWMGAEGEHGALRLIQQHPSLSPGQPWLRDQEKIIVSLSLFLAVTLGIWDLRSPTMDGTHAPCVGNAES